MKTKKQKKKTKLLRPSEYLGPSEFVHKWHSRSEPHTKKSKQIPLYLAVLPFTQMRHDPHTIFN